MDNEDKGHELLIDDLTNLLAHATEYQFHDFRNEKYATPKGVLRARLLTIAESVMGGKYDN